MRAGDGDIWAFTAIDADSKLMISWLVGPRSRWTWPVRAGSLRGMDRNQKAGFLLVLAALSFLAGALLSDPRQPLSFIAAAALLLAGLLRFRRSKRL